MEVFSIDLNSISSNQLLTGVGVVGCVSAVLGKANALWHNPTKVCVEVQVLAEVCRLWLDNQVSCGAEGENPVVGVNTNTVASNRDWSGRRGDHSLIAHGAVGRGCIYVSGQTRTDDVVTKAPVPLAEVHTSGIAINQNGTLARQNICSRHLDAGAARVVWSCSYDVDSTSAGCLKLHLPLGVWPCVCVVAEQNRRLRGS